jgi:adhesin transport system membrane fusion protein
MRDAGVLDLSDCTEFRQALIARPPAVVHGAALLLALLLGTALAWSAWTRADLVVRAPGRVRPVTPPVKVFNPARGDSLSGTAGGRVVEALARPGDRVRQGDVLVRLDAGRLDNEIARRQALIRAGEEEAARLDAMGATLDRQLEAARAKAEADLAEAREAVREAADRRAAEVRLAEIALASAEQQEAVARRLAERGASTAEELNRAGAAAREARERLGRARMPTRESGIVVARRALELVEQDYAVRREDLELRRRAKGGEVESARLELANLELERQQSVIRAPLTGVVTSGEVKAGDVLEPGRPLMEMAREAEFVFEAAVRSEEIGDVRVGMPARIKLDAYDYQRYGTLGGTVRYISPDSGVPEGQAAALYVVRIAVPRPEVGRGEYRGTARLGMAGQVEIVTGRESLLSLLTRRIRQTISLG